MTITTTNTYTDKDFEALKNRLRLLMKSVRPDWDTTNDAGMGNILMDLFAVSGDVANFYNDSNYQEISAQTARFLQTLINMAYDRDYELPLQVASTGPLACTITAISNSITIESGTQFSTSGANPVVFQNTSESIIASGTSSFDLTIENSENKTQTIEPSGEASWRKWLTFSPYLEMVSVVDDLGSPWTKVSSLVDSSSTDQHYETRINSEGQVQLRFGNGIFGAIPENKLTVVYKIGGGKAGNVDANTITEVLNNIVDAAGNPVSMSVTNTQAFVDGEDLLSVDSARRLVPLAGRSQKRTVSNQDFENNALLVSGVSRSLALSTDIDSSVPERYQDLIIVPNGGGIPSDALITEIENFFSNTGEYPALSGITLRVFGATYKVINIQVTAYRYSGSTVEELKETMEEDLNEYFSLIKADGTVNTKIDFGGRHVNSTGAIDSVLPYSDLYNIAVNNIHTRKLGLLLLNENNIDVPLQLREFPTIGIISIIDGDTGAIL